MPWGTSNYEVSFAAYESLGCPVCGDATGNCVGDSEYSGAVVFDDTPRRYNPAATFTVPRRVFSEEYVGTKKVKRLIHPVGARITPEEARALGLLPASPSGDPHVIMGDGKGS